jgi:hypothetical protein
MGTLISLDTYFFFCPNAPAFRRKKILKMTVAPTDEWCHAQGRVMSKRQRCSTFGPQVSKTVENLTEDYGNIVVTCSKSGKLTKKLFVEYLERTLKPYVGENVFLLLVESWGGQADATIYDDTFGKQSGEVTCTVKVILPKCTPLCQPYHVYFYCQMKNLIKKLQHASDLLKEQREITSREDAIKIHSIVRHQLSAPVFENMIKYAWFASKLTSNRSIFNNVNEVCFPVTLT